MSDEGEKKAVKANAFPMCGLRALTGPEELMLESKELCFNPLSPGLSFNVKKEMDDGAESSFFAQEFEGCTVNFEREEV